MTSAEILSMMLLVIYCMCIHSCCEKSCLQSCILLHQMVFCHNEVSLRRCEEAAFLSLKCPFFASAAVNVLNVFGRSSVLRIHGSNITVLGHRQRCVSLHHLYGINLPTNLAVWPTNGSMLTEILVVLSDIGWSFPLLHPVERDTSLRLSEALRVNRCSHPASPLNAELEERAACGMPSILSDFLEDPFWPLTRKNPDGIWAKPIEEDIYLPSSDRPAVPPVRGCIVTSTVKANRISKPPVSRFSGI
ncbi:hypothetical protein J6590_001961 [Homalodisca vitripennis]|nr:hypothetical protein J6590_001961 [Homalodisca vitripennis]